MKSLAPRLLPLLLCLLLPAAWAQQVRLRMLETTDLHMNLLGYDYYQDKVVEDYGLEAPATLIKAARAEAGTACSSTTAT
jgi:2',3'-cyclic-nucleotide 2'-phosphodiesterase/3'-nucleotidase